MTIRGWRRGALLLVMGWLCGGTVVAAEGLEAEFGPRGLVSLRWAGAELLGEGVPVVSGVVLESRSRNAEGVDEYSFEHVEAEPRVTFDAANRVFTQTYPWGTVALAYAAAGERLDLALSIANKSERPLANFAVTPLRLKLPEPVAVPKRWQRGVTLPGQLGVVEARYGGQKLLWCSESVGPLRLGFGKPTDGGRGVPLTLSGGVHMLAPGAVAYHHHGLPRVEPGGTLTVRASLRFAAAEADAGPLTTDVVAAFREYHRPRMVWEDRRPIGAIFIAHGYGPDHNPRNWFRDAEMDVRTEAGRAKLRERMLAHADRCIKTLQATNAQGMVLWDPEGGENPHPITYIGDPRMVPLVAPEMDGIWRAYFQRFRDAGLRTGVCIRPSQVYLTPFTNACDGDPDTRWSVQGFPQWLEVDFGAEQLVDRSELLCFKGRVYPYRLEARGEAGEYQVVVDRTGEEQAGGQDGPTVDRFEPVRARFVRLTITGPDQEQGKWCSVSEWQVFGKEGDNLCRDRARATSRSFGRSVGGHVYYHDPKRNPLGDDYGDIWPEGLPAERFFPIVERMSRKIAYARERWGCTLFYVDTNGVQRPVGEEQSVKWTLLDNHVWRDLHRRHPDVLLIPEFAPNPGQLAYTTTYLQPPYSPPVLRPAWRELLPGAFGVSYTVNLKPEEWEQMRPRLASGVGAGDALFFRGWFGDRYNLLIKALYDEVYEPEAINPGLPASYLRPPR